MGWAPSQVLYENDKNKNVFTINFYKTSHVVNIQISFPVIERVLLFFTKLVAAGKKTKAEIGETFLKNKKDGRVSLLNY